MEAHQRDARAANPHAHEIVILRARAKALYDEAASLTSDAERYWNLMAALTNDFDSRAGAAKVMSNQELGDHLSNLFYEVPRTDMGDAILMEALERIGWRAEEET